MGLGTLSVDFVSIISLNEMCNLVHMLIMYTPYVRSGLWMLFHVRYFRLTTEEIIKFRKATPSLQPSKDRNRSQ